MGEDLKKVNKSFEIFISKFKNKPTNKQRILLYMSFFAGFIEGSKIEQEVI